MSASTTGNSGSRLATDVLAMEVQLLLADRNAIVNHPAVSAFYLGEANGQETTTKKLPQLGLFGYDDWQEVAEGASATTTLLTDSSVTISIARHVLARSQTDYLAIIQGEDLQGVATLAREAVVGSGMTLTDKIAQLASGFSSNVGTSGANMTVQNFFDAVTTLELAEAPMTPLAILHGRQYRDFVDALRAETGVLEHQPATAEQMAVRGQGYKGRYLGVDVFTSSKVPLANSGADRAGMMICPGAIAWMDSMVPIRQGMIAQNIGKVLLAYDYDPKSGINEAVLSYHFGVVEALDGAGVRITTDA